MWYIQSDSAGGIRGDSGQTSESYATGVKSFGEGEQRRDLKEYQTPVNAIMGFTAITQEHVEESDHQIIRFSSLYNRKA